MKIEHQITRALKSPKVEKTYGARVGGVTIRGGKVIMEWEIFSHKVRTKKRGRPRLNKTQRGVVVPLKKMA